MRNMFHFYTSHSQQHAQRYRFTFTPPPPPAARAVPLEFKATAADAATRIYRDFKIATKLYFSFEIIGPNRTPKEAFGMMKPFGSTSSGHRFVSHFLLLCRRPLVWPNLFLLPRNSCVSLIRDTHGGGKQGARRGLILPPHPNAKCIPVFIRRRPSPTPAPVFHRFFSTDSSAPLITNRRAWQAHLI
jgi:hypothetical protein